MNFSISKFSCLRMAQELPIRGLSMGGGVAARISAEHRCTSRSPSSCVELETQTLGAMFSVVVLSLRHRSCTSRALVHKVSQI